LKARELDSFRVLITGDESSFVLECQHSAKWSVARYEVHMRVSQTIGTQKVMLTVVSRVNGFHHVDMVPPGEFQHRLLPYSDHGFFLVESLSEGKESHALRLSVHLNNCRFIRQIRQKVFNEN
jgi:hypothetical protein